MKDRILEKRGQLFLMFRYICAVLLMGATNTLHAGTTYYVCNCAKGADSDCIAGNDNNSGTSPDAPWQSFDKAISVFNAMNGGDQVLLADGSAWDSVQVQLFNTNASANNRITLSDYRPAWASGDEKHPLLQNDSSDILDFEDAGNADHDEGYVVRNLRFQGKGGGFCIFLYNDVDYVLLDSLEIDDFGIGVYVAAGHDPNPGADIESQHVELKNSRITNCTGQGFLGAGSDLLIDGCYFAHNGTTSMFDHNVYIGAHDNITNVTIRNNELYQADYISGKADGVSMVVHGSVSGLLIEGNYIHEDTGAVTPNAWGIGVDPGGYAEPEGFNGVVIRGNKLVNTFNTGIAVASCPGAIIENNVIINEGAAGFTGISAPDRFGQAKDSVMSSVSIINNSIYMRNGNAETVGIFLGGEGTGHVLANNIVSTDAGNCISLDLPDNAYSAVDYNLGQITGQASWSNNQDLSTWASSSGFDTYSLTGDPLFVSPGAPDYDLELSSASSPAVNAGDASLAASTDFTGRTRTGVPDIGAFEYGINTGLKTISPDETILISPDPVSAYLTVQSDLFRNNRTVTGIFDMSGRKVLSKKLCETDNTLNISSLANGIYILHIRSGNRNLNQKFVVRH